MIMAAERSQHKQRPPPTSGSSAISSLHTSQQGLSLVPHTTPGSFSLEVGRSNNLYTSVIFYKSGVADSPLNKQLKRSIGNVERRVTTTKSSFATVDRIIRDPALQISKDVADPAQLLDEWSAIKSDFENTLDTSRGVAMEGAVLITDFLESIVPYLLGDGDLAKKQQEIHGYRNTLNEGRNCAKQFANDLSSVSDRVLEFKRKWGAHTNSTLQIIQREINLLQKDIKATSESIATAKREFSSVIAQKRFEDEAGSSNDARVVTDKAVEKKLKGLVKDARQASKVHRKVEVQVSRRTVDIQEKSDNLITVWELIHDDVGVVESHIKTAEQGKSNEVFKQRIGDLAVQYAKLREALHMYEKAMTSSNRGFLRRLLK